LGHLLGNVRGHSRPNINGCLLSNTLIPCGIISLTYSQF
jgi:hypothetical protein